MGYPESGFTSEPKCACGNKENISVCARDKLPMAVTLKGDPSTRDPDDGAAPG